MAGQAPPVGTLSRIHHGAVGLYSRWKLRLAGTEKLPRPVLSVGNLAFGGTGKTPFTLWLAKLLSREGYVVCILSRGYGGVRTADPMMVSDLWRMRASPVQAGDEPYLLARKLPGVPVVVGHDRAAAGRMALDELKDRVHLFLLDDGFQHRRLERDADVVLLDARDPWSGLREGPSALVRAHAVIATRAHRVSDEDLKHLQAQVAAVAPEATFLTARTRPTGFRRLSASTGDLPSLEESKIYAFCGLARPGAFFEDLKATGLNVVRERSFADHRPYSKEDFRRMLADAEECGASAIVTTEKDGVRLPLSRAHAFPPVHALRHEVVPDDLEALVKVLSQTLPPPRIAGRR
jgi:tetraacyldisaccharide 4'-kinase